MRVVAYAGDGALGGYASVCVADEGGHTSVLTASLRLHDGDVHMLAHALIAGGEEGPHGGHGCDGACLIQANLAAKLHWLAVRQASAAHFAAHAVEDDFRTLVLAIGAALSEVGDGCEDYVGVRRPQRFVVQTERCHDSGAKALYNEVDLLRQLKSNRQPSRVFQVEGDATLVGVEVQEEAALLRVRLVSREGA